MATARKWSAKVNTESTYPKEGLFTKGPRTIAKELASKRVSPKGLASGMRMLNFYINRAGKNLSESRRDTLEKAKEILSRIIADNKTSAHLKKLSHTTASSHSARRRRPATKPKTRGHARHTASKTS